MFKIKIKTKSGNDLKNKQSFNVLFSITVKENALTKLMKTYYTFAICYSKKTYSLEKVYELKEESKDSFEILLKILINLITTVDKICKDENIVPDIIYLTSLDYKTINRFIIIANLSLLGSILSKYEVQLSSNHKNYELLELLKKLVDNYPTTHFVKFPIYETGNPNKKNQKSVNICNKLKIRLNTLKAS